MEGGSGTAGVDEREEGEGGVDVELLGEPAEGEAHKELEDGGGDGHGGLGAAHEVARNDVHERGLGDDARERAEESEERLKQDGEDENGDKRHSEVAEREPGERERVERHEPEDRLARRGGETH